MSPDSNILNLRFGTELELLIRSKINNHESFESLASDISKELTAAKIPNHVADIFAKDDEKYQDWSIVDEISITSRRKEFRYGVELVSPIMEFSDQRFWVGQVNAAWKALEGFEIQSTSQCSTHVHISPVQGCWSLDQVKGIAKAAVYFERCIDALVPGQRRVNNWCKSNRWNHRFKPLSLQEVFAEIEQQPTTEKVAERMCWCSKNSATGASLNASEDFKHYTFRWNLASLVSSKGTIEFRQPPPSENSESSIAWVMFAVSFARWASQCGSTLDPLKPSCLDDLYSHVLKGAELNQVEDTSPLRRIFYGVMPLPQSLTYDIKEISPAEVQQLRVKAKERDITLEKYKHLFGYK